MKLSPYELTQLAAEAADEKKAHDIRIIKLSGLSDVCDYALLATAENSRLLDALTDKIKEELSEQADTKPLSVEGTEDLTWVLLDYGCLIVHLFLPETRDYYRLENLWADAEQKCFPESD